MGIPSALLLMCKITDDLGGVGGGYSNPGLRNEPWVRAVKWNRSKRGRKVAYNVQEWKVNYSDCMSYTGHNDVPTDGEDRFVKALY